MIRSPERLWHWQEGMSRQESRHYSFTKLQPQHPLPLLLRHECYANGPDTGPHHHLDFYALYVVQSGQGIHIIDQYPYMMVPGDIYLLPPGSTHAYQHYDALEIDAFYFQHHFFTYEELAALHTLPYVQDLFAGRESGANRVQHLYLHLSPQRHRALNDIIAEISIEYSTEGAAAILLTRGQLFRLFVTIARQQESSGQSAVFSGAGGDIASSAALAHVLCVCEERFHEPLTVPQLADLLSLSPSRFSEIFTQATGVPPATYIRRLRLEYAQTLLRTTTLSVSEIAQRVGFNDGPRLARAFRTAFHLTPTDYRATVEQGTGAAEWKGA